MDQGRYDDALTVLKTVRPADRAEAELQDVITIAQQEEKAPDTGLKAILSNKLLFRILLVSIGVSMTQQLTGINSIMYYGQEVILMIML